MRGAHVGDELLGVVDGIIPADAGSTQKGDLLHHAGQDHPRGCGEHTVPNQGDTRVGGSSPRMRGALRRAIFCTMPVRIIPADAGSTPCPTRVIRGSGDHPRGCGEHEKRPSSVSMV